MSIPSKVLLLCWRDTGHPQGGGSERYLERVGTELASRGVGVTLLTARYPGSGQQEYRDGLRIIRAGGRLGVYPSALAIIAAGRLGMGPLAGFDPDLVVDTQNGVPFFATTISGAPTVVLVHHCHREQWPVAGRLLGYVGWFIESRLSPWVHRRNRYVTVSRPSARELAELGVDPERITVIHNGIDPVPADLLAPPTPSTDSPSTARLCVLSRLVPHKQVEHALDVVDDLRHTRDDVHLDVIGGGWWDDRLRAYARELGVDDYVTFHGHVDERRKHELLAAADVHLMPSRKEGWGLAVIEAAQHGVPTVGYRSSVGLAESITTGETGLLVDGPDEFISATRKLVDDPAAARRLGDNARRKAAGYSWSSTADGFAALCAANTMPARSAANQSR
ncbi:glycosyltransferase family 4 protein [Gordonia sp. (in: high G+C Gram-positive bacteria)]|uniref:glycosyltransferase family 4 protein n=1 Tax=Gordonia sp. (in: high G+C Gram-positive bacteria) TaxID=84139 RepID=UPI001D8E67E5|nr:glycosyltransferase family 4 protein [Gordonia sp. (in: high G+C Gram-positive bacteria)]MCB1293216.1 glycosyltransferase family 4 protein [Gordonia sp. (in: high G+C Gram-positive bacteria)]HMS75999.1 glycosyltransferase family 4 protein [Gordonia sp. (in: high G+C Gram-positive bacteria)]